MRQILIPATIAVVFAQASLARASEGGGKAAFVPLDEIVVPIVDGTRAYGRLRIKIVLIPHNPAALPLMTARVPQLRETALVATAEFARLYATPFAPVDAQRLSNDISVSLAARDRDHTVSRVLVVKLVAEQR